MVLDQQPNDEVEKECQAKEQFWGFEEGTRMTNAKLTPFERHQLVNHSWATPALRADALKVVDGFGCPKGYHAACQRLLMAISKEKKFTPGQVCCIRTPEFTLCKHLMISAWNKLRPLDEDLQVPTKVTCSCMARTCFMVEGCIHNKVPIYSQGYYYQQFCATCSKCMRCQG